MRTNKKLALYFAALIAAQGMSLFAFDAGVSLSVSPSPMYNGQWDPAVGGASVAVDARFPGRAFGARVGLEAGVEGLGFQLLMPLRLERILWRDGNRLSLSANVAVIPGLAMFRPAPLLMIGAGAGIGLSWYWSEAWGLEAEVGLRYGTCPEYSSRVAPYSVVTVPVSLALRLRR